MVFSLYVSLCLNFFSGTWTIDRWSFFHDNFFEWDFSLFDRYNVQVLLIFNSGTAEYKITADNVQPIRLQDPIY